MRLRIQLVTISDDGSEPIQPAAELRPEGTGPKLAEAGRS